MLVGWIVAAVFGVLAFWVATMRDLGTGVSAVVGVVVFVLWGGFMMARAS